MIKNNIQLGFALPSVLIASVVMMIVLVTAVTSVTTTRTALNNQYYNQLAKEAAESGIVKADMCVRSNQMTVTWTSASPLRPNTDCHGNIVAGMNAYVLEHSDLRTSFSIGVESISTDQDTGTMRAEGVLERVRAVDNQVWQTHTQLLRADLRKDSLYATSGSSGRWQVCAVLNGQTWCNGANNWGQMGNGTDGTLAGGPIYIAPEAVHRLPGGLLNKRDKLVVSGNAATCTVTTDNEIYCWGRAEQGMLGIGSASDGVRQLVPARVQKPAGMTGEVTHVALAHQSGCAVAGGDVWCWGRDDLGQTGSGGSDRANKLSPVRAATIGASNGRPVTDISSSPFRQGFCAVASGLAYCWGDNAQGQLGDSTSVSHRTTPTLVYRESGRLAGKTVVKVVASGSYRKFDESETLEGAAGGCNAASRHCYRPDHACALTSNGEMYCWGRNTYGQLGQGSWNTTIYRTPQRVLGNLSGKTVRDIAVSYYTSCALTTEPDTGNRYYCWGANYGGQLGIGNQKSCGNYDNPALCSPYPVEMLAGGLQNKHISSISGGVNRNCAIAEGTLYCMGTNTMGQIGDGTSDDRNIPTKAHLFSPHQPLLYY